MHRNLNIMNVTAGGPEVQEGTCMQPSSMVNFSLFLAL